MTDEELDAIERSKGATVDELRLITEVRRLRAELHEARELLASTTKAADENGEWANQAARERDALRAERDGAVAAIAMNDVTIANDAASIATLKAELAAALADVEETDATLERWRAESPRKHKDADGMMRAALGKEMFSRLWGPELERLGHVVDHVLAERDAWKEHAAAAERFRVSAVGEAEAERDAAVARAAAAEGRATARLAVLFAVETGGLEGICALCRSAEAQHAESCLVDAALAGGTQALDAAVAEAVAPWREAVTAFFDRPIRHDGETHLGPVEYERPTLPAEKNWNDRLAILRAAQAGGREALDRAVADATKPLREALEHARTLIKYDDGEAARAVYARIDAALAGGEKP